MKQHFLYGDLDEGYDDYLEETHKIIEDPRTYCVKLNKALYGLVQAARQWWKKFKEIMLSLGQMEHFVGCYLIENKEKDTLWINQPKLMKNLKTHFGQ